jgi:hypothetical protein
VNPEINFFVSTLRRMGKYWKVADRYASILQRVLDEYAEYKQAVGTAKERVTPSSVKILADMRRCAFDLDVLISRQPRNQVTAANTPRPAGTPARNLGANELEYLDVFGLPNLPTLGQTDGMSRTMTPNPTVVAASGGPMAVSELGSGSTVNIHEAAGSVTNEFNITNYMMPTPETDWLFRTATS